MSTPVASESAAEPRAPRSMRVAATPFHVGWRDHLFGLALCVAYVSVLLPASAGMGMSRDESFYVIAAERYGAWIERLFEDSRGARTPEGITEGWEYNNEHPPVFKVLFALSWMADKKWDVFPEDSMAFRFPGMVSAGLMLWLLYIFGARAFGRTAGVIAALAYALLPRPFYHAQLDCFDVPIAFMLTLVTYCYWRSLTRRRWAIWTGIAYGFALGTKHNAWILPGVLLIHWVWTLLGEIAERRAGKPWAVSYVPWWLPASLLIGPAIFFATWPWMWLETKAHLSSYVRFHVHHVHYNYAYFGVNWFRPPFPVHVPFVMTFFTVPLSTLSLALVGIGARLRAVVPPVLRAKLPGIATPDRHRTDVLLLGTFLAPLVVIALPSTPIFGGTKHWFASYPPMAIFAGYAFTRVIEILRERYGQRLGSAWRAVPFVAGALVMTPPLLETEHSHMFGLSHYTVGAGGVAGAADHGMNRQFWGFTTGSLTEWLKHRMPNGGSVWLCDTTWWAWQMLQRDGRVPTSIRAAQSIASADYALVHHEHHFVKVDYQIWTVYGRVDPVYVLTHDGVPIISVYENPARRRRSRP